MHLDTVALQKEIGDSTPAVQGLHICDLIGCVTSNKLTRSELVLIPVYVACGRLIQHLAVQTATLVAVH